MLRRVCLGGSRAQAHKNSSFGQYNARSKASRVRSFLLLLRFSRSHAPKISLPQSTPSWKGGGRQSTPPNSTRHCLFRAIVWPSPPTRQTHTDCHPIGPCKDRPGPFWGARQNAARLGAFPEGSHHPSQRLGLRCKRVAASNPSRPDSGRRASRWAGAPTRAFGRRGRCQAAMGRDRVGCRRA